MKRTFSFCVFSLVLAIAVPGFADIAPPKPSPSPKNSESKIALRTSMAVVPDSKTSSARLEISQDTLKELRDALNAGPTSGSLTHRIAQSSTRTVVAGLLLFASLSLSGVWLARSSRFSASNDRRKALAVGLIVMATLGSAAIVTRGNVGPPPTFLWRNLPQNLNAGRPTYASVDIEIVPEGSGIKLIVPSKKSNGEN